MSPSERTQSQTLQPGRNQFTQRPGAGRGQMQNLFTGRWRGTRAPSARFQVPPSQGAKSPTLSSAQTILAPLGPDLKTRGSPPPGKGVVGLPLPGGGNGS